ncbi:MAG: SH3 domain-containing protein, partial [Clostridia bacterium]
HGSNSMWRQSIRDGAQVDSVMMEPGMAVFKRRMDGGEPEKYRADGQGNFYHVGLYVGDGRVIHAMGAQWGVVDGALENGWTHAGWLQRVDYPTRATEEGTDKMRRAVVTSPQGGAVKLRGAPSTSAVWLTRVPSCTEVDVLERGDVWTRIRAGDKTGYMSSEFLRPVEATDAEDAPLEENMVDIRIPRTVAEALHAALAKYMA